MKVDILSDLHIDFYLPKGHLSARKIKLIFEPIITDNGTKKIGDILIIAGDIGHYNKQNIEVLKVLKDEYYKYIICVLGNHDYYLVSSNAKQHYKKNSFKRAQEMKELINAETNIYCLDGDIVELEGIRFGGTMGWYSDAYLKAYQPLRNFSRDSINELWKNSISDYNFIYGVKYYDELYQQELPKIEAVYKDCDVMITHVNPSYKNKHIAPRFKHYESNTFFTFNADRFLDLGNMKYWIFGHTHDAIEYELHGVWCLCSPLGYPNENITNVKMKSIEINYDNF